MTEPAEVPKKRDPIAVTRERRSDLVSVLAVTGHFAIVYAAVYFAAWYGPGWSTIPLWLWFGILGHGYHQLLHECAHKLTFREPSWNDRLARWFVAPLYLADFEAFRARHFMHHRELGLEGDPKYTYRTDVRGGLFVRLLVSMLTMRGAVRKAALQVGEKSGATEGSTRRAVVAILIVQPIFALSVLGAAWLGHRGDWQATLWSAAVAYFFVYLYGVGSLTVMVATLRGIAEHRAGTSDPSAVGIAALRNFTHQPLDWLVFGTYGFTDHATHHRYPAVPSYLLPEVTEQLAAAEPEFQPVGTHAHILAQLINPPQSAPARQPSA